MKTFMAATLLATTFAAQAVTNRDLKVVCGSQEEMAATLEVYQEIPYVVFVSDKIVKINLITFVNAKI